MSHSTDSRALNPTLLSLLKRRFGEEQVTVSNSGRAIHWKLQPNPQLRSRSKGPRLVRRVIDSGEEYVLCCPFCNDTRRRLTINHRWGVHDPETGTRNLWLAQCFNETRCLSNYDRQKQLYEMVYSVRAKNTPIPLRRGKVVLAGQLVEAEWPGPVIRLDHLAEKSPRHPAIAYIESRGFDPDRLGRRYGVSYCRDSHYGLARDRLVIPIDRKGMMVGWQCRFVGDDVEGHSLKDLNVPKYWTMPRMKKSLAPYNYDRAIRYRTVVIVEGPFDVWSTGSMAFGLLGTKLSTPMLETFVKEMRKRHGRAATVVVMLDPEMPKQIKSRRPVVHPIEQLCHDLAPHFPGRVVPVYLPVGSDPGSLPRSVVHRHIHAAAKRRGISLDLRTMAKS